MERALLMHILAAHHYSKEWGSPVTPSTPEAIMVHFLDNLDAKMLHAWDFITNKPGRIPELTEYSRIEQTNYVKTK